MSNWMYTDPATYDMASTETLPLAINVAAILESGDSPSSPTATLTDVSIGALYPTGISAGPTTFSSNISTVTITGLQAGHRYRLALTFQVAAGKIRTVALTINCPF